MRSICCFALSQSKSLMFFGRKSGFVSPGHVSPSPGQSGTPVPTGQVAKRGSKSHLPIAEYVEGGNHLKLPKGDRIKKARYSKQIVGRPQNASVLPFMHI